MKVRQHLSNCKISGAGQKLLGDWEEALKNMHGRMRAVQSLIMRADGTKGLSGVKDEHFYNTDHVPIWYVSVANYRWGPTFGGRRHVQTGGEEKN